MTGQVARRRFGAVPRGGPRGVPRGLLAVSAALALSAGLAAPAMAQDQVERRVERALRGTERDYRLQVDPNLTLAERTVVEVGGFYSLTALWIDDSSDNNRRLYQHDLTLYGRASLDGVHNGFVRVRFPYRDFSPGDSFDGRGDGWDEPFIDRYSYEFDLRRALQVSGGTTSDYNFNVRVGRQFVDWGAGLALSETLLSVRPTFSYLDRFQVEALVGVTPDSVTDFDSSRAAFDTKTRRGYFGGMFTYLTETGRKYYAYGLRMQDYNTDSRLRSPSGAVTNASFDYNATYIGVGTEGSLGPSLVYLGEFVYALGDSQSDPLQGAQQREDVRAFAGRGQLTYLFRDRNDSRVQFETLVASGDEDRGSTSDTVNGNRPGSEDNAFNALGFANTGLAFAPSLSNLWTLRLGAATFPFRDSAWFSQLQVGADFLVYNKFDESGGSDEATTNKMFLGTELDLFGNWRVTSDLAFNVRYGVFFPDEGIAGAKAARHFVLLGFTLSF